MLDISKKANVRPVFQKGKKKDPDSNEPYNPWEGDGQLVLEAILRYMEGQGGDQE